MKSNTSAVKNHSTSGKDQENTNDGDGSYSSDHDTTLIKAPVLKASSDGSSEEEDGETIQSDGINISCSGTWEKLFDRLKKFREAHGHCRVPFRYNADPQLGAWVAVQRRNYKLLNIGRRKKTSLSLERQNRLKEIGFEWSVEIRWEDRFIQLLEFVVANGHAQVPMKWKENSKLSNWVSAQRREYKNLQVGQASAITQNQIELLNSVGFVWQAERGRTKKRAREEEKAPVVPVSNVILVAQNLLRTMQNASSIKVDSGLHLPVPSTASLLGAGGGSTTLQAKKAIHGAEALELFGAESTAERPKKPTLNTNGEATQGLTNGIGILPNHNTTAELAKIAGIQPNYVDALSNLPLNHASLIQQQIGMGVSGFFPSYPQASLLNRTNDNPYSVAPAATAIIPTVTAGIASHALGLSPTTMNGFALAAQGPPPVEALGLHNSSSGILSPSLFLGNPMVPLGGQHLAARQVQANNPRQVDMSQGALDHLLGSKRLKYSGA